ncbi:uncharacterized protein C1orf159 homolog isoform X2 [Scophthalmus maximus]|uniref:uncharacterized protein C1orf159 homolog isoform X2 n=1 Tax=Scophthalmus maximus TaxID=52904 RepID=UPI0015E0BEB4|nr:uncharacterized protein C1orf159 homolog isoform X2 [Scophthalmus maximus]
MTNLPADIGDRLSIRLRRTRPDGRLNRTQEFGQGQSLVLVRLVPEGSNMALSFLLVLAATVILIRPETPVTKALHQNSLECCGDKLRVNNSCSNDTHCEPASVDLENITVCTYNYTVERKNHTTVTTVTPKIGGPGVAASLLLGTLLISLFLILSVASFFYLKRSNRLPGIFYRRNKAFIFQPSETAVMIPSSSVRKPRYVRRERPSATPTVNSATVPTTSTTQVYNV